MSAVYEEKAEACLSDLGLTVAAAQLDTTSQRAAAEGWSFSHFLGYLLSGELDERRRRTVRLNLQFAKFPVIKRTCDYDFTAQPSLDRRLIDELCTGRFLHEGRNLVFLGPPGVGKTHLAIALGVSDLAAKSAGVIACEMGHRAYFTTAMVMARRLSLSVSQNRLPREMTKLTHPKVLIIDEVGYLTLDSAQASLLFQVIAARYERRLPVILTSNKAFSEWSEVFAGDAVMASAALDRLLHRSTVMHIRGDSYRLKEKRQAASGGTVATTAREAGRPDMTGVTLRAHGDTNREGA